MAVSNQRPQSTASDAPPATDENSSRPVCASTRIERPGIERTQFRSDSTQRPLPSLPCPLTESFEQVSHAYDMSPWPFKNGQCSYEAAVAVNLRMRRQTPYSGEGSLDLLLEASKPLAVGSKSSAARHRKTCRSCRAFGILAMEHLVGHGHE